MRNDKAIPHFDLYGEETDYTDPHFIHIEEIADRSSENGWEISPHRHGKMLQILCMYSGRLNASLDSETYNLTDSCALAIPPGTVHGFRFSPDTEGFVLTVAESVLTGQQSLPDREFLAFFLQLPQVIKLDPNNEIFSQLLQYASYISREIASSTPDHVLTSTWLVKLLLMALRRQLELSQFSVLSGKAAGEALLGFRQLLEQHFRDQWTVKQYANALHLSESTLNRMCNEAFGQAAKSIISRRLITAIKRRLIFTHQPLEQIAYSLGYKDPSYFSRFFKQQTGLSPSRYRKENADVSGGNQLRDMPRS